MLEAQRTTEENGVMIRRRILGPVYTVAVTLKRELESCAGLDDFSTYDRFADSFAWRQFGEVWYMLVPAGRKKNVFKVTMYLEVPKVVKDVLLRTEVKHILEDEFFPKLCGMRIARVNKPVLVTNPAAFAAGDDEDVEFRPESFADMVMHS